MKQCSTSERHQAPWAGRCLSTLPYQRKHRATFTKDSFSLRNQRQKNKNKTKPQFFSDCRGIGSILTLSVYLCLPQSLKQIESPDGIDCGLWSPRTDTDFLSSSLHQLHNHTSLPNPTSKYTMVLAPYFRITPASLFSSLSFLILLNVYKKTKYTLIHCSLSAH